MTHRGLVIRPNGAVARPSREFPVSDSTRQRNSRSCTIDVERDFLKGIQSFRKQIARNRYARTVGWESETLASCRTILNDSLDRDRFESKPWATCFPVNYRSRYPGYESFEVPHISISHCVPNRDTFVTLNKEHVSALVNFIYVSGYEDAVNLYFNVFNCQLCAAVKRKTTRVADYQLSILKLVTQ